MRVLIALMTRVPVPGQTKTRLMTHLTGEECVMLQRAFLEDLIFLLTEVVRLPVCIFFTPGNKAQLLQDLVDTRLPLVPQEGETLGERMAFAIRWGLAHGYEGVLVVGSDIPTLPASVFHEAVEELANCDVVLGPTLDGGYYLIAAKENCPAIFQDIAWGTEDVFAATMRKIKLMNLKPSLLRPWNDVDTFEDLKLLKEELDTLVKENAPLKNCHTRKVLENLAHKL